MIYIGNHVSSSKGYEDVYCHGGGAGAEHRLVEFGGQLVDAQGAGVDDPQPLTEDNRRRCLVSRCKS